MIEKINKFDSILTKNSLPFPREASRLSCHSSFSLDAACLLYNGKRLHIQASMTTYIQLYGTDSLPFSPLSGTKYTTAKQHCLTWTAPPTTDKLLKTRDFKTVDMHFYFIAMLPNVENMDLSHTSMA
jgi:hypothetical protein